MADLKFTANQKNTMREQAEMGSLNEASSCNSDLLCVDREYNFKDQSEKLAYMGKAGNWHQFRKLGEGHTVWAEVLDVELWMIEETKNT